MVIDCDTWPVPEPGSCVGGCDIPADTDEDLLEAASVQAGVILRTLSGNRVGTCSDVLRPLSECGTCRGYCSCGSGDRIRVQSWNGPVTAVTEVTVDGVVLPADDWRFYPSSQTLYRVPPEVWPYRDTKWADCGDPDTMCVEAVIGYPPDAWALAVHAELVCELVKACNNPSKCRLPKNATQVVGQGISITLTPEQLKDFIPAVAGWVAAVNPDGAQQPGRVFSPDLGWPNG